jgi:hypothetical protein
VQQGVALAGLGAAEHAPHCSVKQGNGVVGQTGDRIEHRRHQDRAAAQGRQGPQMLGSEAGTLARELAQAFGMHAFGAGRIESDGAENSALLGQAGEGAMAWNARRLTRPGQGAHRRAFLDRQQSFQGRGLRRKQISGQLTRDLALGEHQGRGHQTLDHRGTGGQDLSAAQLIHQGFGGRHGVGRAEGRWQQPSQ